ncbi:DUF58 domain-containing protein [Halorussus amylolyticus]|uniref:DUF58 domain-containing protein n=1 Tax=Halorussus amylolyticus TaxID=1126242 RepID=UPI00104C4AA6|nr:DUF58 domain-containing protein [Halorussus amylolyticus]
MSGEIVDFGSVAAFGGHHPYPNDVSDSDDDDADDSGRDDTDDSDDSEGRVFTPGAEWDPGVTVALLAGAVGLLTGNTTTFLAGTVGFAYAAYRYATRVPDPEVSVERDIDDRSPLPSREVEITLTVRNDGDSAVPDLRIVDGVPDRLEVVSGSPRHATSLRPDESERFSYVVRARRGAHEFGPTTLVARSISGTAERRFERRVAGSITCETRAEDFPLPAETSSYPGHITTDSGGEGVEFYATREFQPSDPMSRIDWKRFARTRELTTVEFRETRAATVVVVVDARTAAHVARRDGEPDAVALSEYAAERLAAALLRRNDRVGLARFGPSERYLRPGGGDEQAARIRAELESTAPPDDRGVGLFTESRRERANESRFDTLRKRLPDSAQVLFLSPLADEQAVDVAKRFRAYGHAITVVSPDVTGTDTPGGAVERIERNERIAEVRAGEVRVIDWSPDDPIRVAVSAATTRWSK